MKKCPFGRNTYSCRGPVGAVEFRAHLDGRMIYLCNEWIRVRGLIISQRSHNVDLNIRSAGEVWMSAFEHILLSSWARDNMLHQSKFSSDLRTALVRRRKNSTKPLDTGCSWSCSVPSILVIEKNRSVTPVGDFTLNCWATRNITSK